MSAAATYTILLVAAYTMTVLLAAWLCLQLMMWVLSFNIRRILALRNRTACDYLEKGRFWKDGGNRYVWYLRGPGMARLAKTVLVMARREVRESNLRANTTLYGQCSVCIFLAGCTQKYQIGCGHCVFHGHCSLRRQKRGDAICRHFKCSRWIECD